MNKDKLFHMIKNRKPSKETLGMILSNNMDYCNSDGALISGKMFNAVSEAIIDYFTYYYGLDGTISSPIVNERSQKLRE